MTLREAQRRWSVRRRQYVVGYIASGNTLYHHEKWDKRHTIPLPMTLREARTRLAQMPSTGCAIFQLTPIAIGGGQS